MAVLLIERNSNHRGRDWCKSRLHTAITRQVMADGARPFFNDGCLLRAEASSARFFSKGEAVNTKEIRLNYCLELYLMSHLFFMRTFLLSEILHNL